MKDKDNSIPNVMSDETMLNDLRCMLNEELAKPENERDLDKVRDITAAMVELSDVKIPQPPSADFILNKAAQKKRSGIRVLHKWAAAVSACFAVGIALNCYTLAAYGENLLEVVLRKTQSGFTLDLSQEPDDNRLVTNVSEYTTTQWSVPWKTTNTEGSDTNVTTETTAIDKQGNGTSPSEMIAYIGETIEQLCGEHGFAPLVPTELPPEMAFNGFFKADEIHYEKMQDSEDFYFTFSNGNEQQFSLAIEKYQSHDDLPEILIPSDNQEFIEGTENGIHVYAFPSRNRVTAIFTDGSCSYTLNGYNISADAMMKLAYSFVPSESDIK